MDEAQDTEFLKKQFIDQPLDREIIRIDVGHLGSNLRELAGNNGAHA